MRDFLPFSNPIKSRFHGASGNSILSARMLHMQREGFLYTDVSEDNNSYFQSTRRYENV